jgi:hypothetical protein
MLILLTIRKLKISNLALDIVENRTPNDGNWWLSAINIRKASKMMQTPLMT